MDEGGARRDEANRQRSRDLAARLAANAEDMADTLDRAAELHEAIAADTSHPLHEGSAARAAAERQFAANEREAASWLLSNAEDSEQGSERPARGTPPERRGDAEARPDRP